VNKALEEGTLLILRSTVHGGLNHLLKHSASTLVETIEVEVVQDLLLLRAQALDKFLYGKLLLFSCHWNLLVGI
jgi:hypothetical protein